ncbi:MAG: hypothetical protein EOO03_05065 [Chitinophagaceae bacterium]|nr:MAG: hypothetical protein EOO03_05065 [Chitinophagaceae bacterium]
MKKLLLPPLSLVAMLASVSCKKIITAVFDGADISIPPVEMTLPIVLAVSPAEQNLGSYTQSINLDSAIRAKTSGIFGINAVSTIKLKEVNLSLANGEALNNLSNFETARVTIMGSSNTSSAELFSVNFPDQNLFNYTFAPGNELELLPFLRGNTITYTVLGKNRRITTKPLALQLRVTLRAN